jgi:FXSXX-COOH protein
VAVTGDSPEENPQPDWQSPMVDVSGMSLDDLADEAIGTALAHSLRLLAETRNNPAGPIAGFNSAL